MNYQRFLKNNIAPSCSRIDSAKVRVEASVSETFYINVHYDCRTTVLKLLYLTDQKNFPRKQIT